LMGYPLPRTGKVTKVGYSNEPTLRACGIPGGCSQFAGRTNKRVLMTSQVLQTLGLD
jgi:hypothetical protein